MNTGAVRPTLIGLGTMQLTGKGVWGPPVDWSYAVRLLRRAYDLGVRVFDTAWYYGPLVTHQLLRAAFYPYPEDLQILTKAGNSRGPRGEWQPSLDPPSLRKACETDLTELRLDSIPISLLRWKPATGDETAFRDAVACMQDLRNEGKIRKIGLSNIRLGHLNLAADILDVSAVSNAYSLYNRRDEATLVACHERGIDYMPYYPLLGGDAVRIPAVERVATNLSVSPAQVALAWLRARSDVVIPIPGTSRIGHLEENVSSSEIRLSPGDLAQLDDVPRFLSG